MSWVVLPRRTSALLADPWTRTSTPSSQSAGMSSPRPNLLVIFGNAHVRRRGAIEGLASSARRPARKSSWSSSNLARPHPAIVAGRSSGSWLLAAVEHGHVELSNDRGRDLFTDRENDGTPAPCSDGRTVLLAWPTEPSCA